MTQPTIFPIVPYKDVRAAIEWLGEAFGFTVHALHEDSDGTIVHCELALGDSGMIMPTGERGGDVRIPFNPGPTWLYVVVEDADAHHDRAVAAGAEIVSPLEDQDYGSRDYTAKDPGGNLWSFGTYQPYRE
jgi:uncharacterized glyoxalase superfamily protein PhnB